MEYRLPGADTNPYMTLAFVLGAGLHGIETNSELPPSLTSPVGSDTGYVVDKSLPNDLYEASVRLNASQKSREIFGSDFVDYLVSACVHESEETKRYVSNLERQRYLEIV
jgi:glutamine synthetase